LTLESHLGQLRAIQLPIRVRHLGAKDSHDLRVDRLPWLHQRAPQLVGLDHVRTKLAQPRSHGAFAAAKPSGQPHAQHHSPRLILAALTVFAMSIAIVRGPTPPGTGVYAPATSNAFGCTSPTMVDPRFRKFSARLPFPAKNFSNSSLSVMRLMP